MMKLLIILCIEEDTEDVAGLLRKAGVQMFSRTEITGFNTEYPAILAGEWFASGKESVQSAALFTFSVEEKIEAALQLVNAHNESKKPVFPLKAFVLPVETFS